MAEWQPISTLPDAEMSTDIVLWSPCDGVHLLSFLATPRELERIRTDHIFTHWQRLEPPTALTQGERE